MPTEVPEGIIYKNRRYITEESVEIVDLISEGEIGGLATGVYSVNGIRGELGWRSSSFAPYKTPSANDGNEFLRSVYWNETPIIDEAGRLNFQRASISYGNGSPDGNRDLKIGLRELISANFSVSSWILAPNGLALSANEFLKGPASFQSAPVPQSAGMRDDYRLLTPRDPHLRYFHHNALSSVKANEYSSIITEATLLPGRTSGSARSQYGQNTTHTNTGITAFHSVPVKLAAGRVHALNATLTAPIGSVVLLVVGDKLEDNSMRIGFAGSSVITDIGSFSLNINFSSEIDSDTILIFVRAGGTPELKTYNKNSLLLGREFPDIYSQVSLTSLKIGIYKGLNTASMIKPTDRIFRIDPKAPGPINLINLAYSPREYRRKVLAIEQAEALVNQRSKLDQLIANIERGTISKVALEGIIDIEAATNVEILNLKFTNGTFFQNFVAYDSQGSSIGLKLTAGGGDDSYRLAFTSAGAKAKTDNSYGGIYRIVESPIDVGQEFCIAIKAAGGMSDLSAGSCKIRISFRANDSNNDEIFGIDMDIKDTYPSLVLYEAFAISSRAVSSYRIYISLLEPNRYMTFNSIRVNKAAIVMKLALDERMDTVKDYFLSIIAAGKYRSLRTQPDSFFVVTAVSDESGSQRLLSRKRETGKSSTNITDISSECHSIVPGALFEVQARGFQIGTAEPATDFLFYVPYRTELDLRGLPNIIDGQDQDHNKSAVLSLSNLLLTQDSNVTKTQQKEDKLLGYQVNSTGDEINPRNFHERSYSVLDRNASDISINFKLSALSVSNVGNGNLEDSSVTLKVTVSPLYNKGGPAEISQSKEFTLEGRVTTPYIKSYRIHVGSSPARANPYFIGWQIKVVKAMPEPTLVSVRNQVFVKDINYETDYSLSYPNCALVRQTFAAEFFSEIPSRAFDTYLLKIKIPDIYDPMTRSYNVDPSNGSKSYEANGSPSVLPWTGRFKGSTIDGVYVEEKVWSDNPAWCFYDLITNPRYGLGKYIDDETIDKWTLFEIAKYCDEIVENEDGTLENRFSCNVSLNSREDAHKVLDDMASIFRGMVYYYNNSIITIQDSQKNPVYSFNNSNVNDGNFIYSNSSRKVRRTVALVRYNDKNDFYKPGIEYVEDIEGIKSHGYREVDVTAFGCSSKHQARRLGKWILFTENLETETVSFRTGLEGSIVRPGDVVTIVDSNRSTSRVGGRLKKLVAGTGTSWNFHLDGLLSLTNNRDYKLIINLPDYNYDPSLGISDLKSTDYAGVRNSHILTFKFTTANMSTVDSTTVISNPDLAVPAQSRLNLGNSPQNLIWSVVSDSNWDLIADGSYMPEEKYRVLNVKSNADLTYDMSALEYREDKYSLVEE